MPAERGVEFPFDALGILVQLCQRLLERVPKRINSFSTSSLPMDVVGPPQWSGSLTTQAGPMARPGEMLRPVNVASDSA